MSKIGIKLVLAGLGVLGSMRGIAQTAKPAAPTLKTVVVLTRHGVRSPTWTQTRLDSYSALPWPKWSVPPGNLTARGHQLMTRFGSYDRTSFVRMGLFAASGCGDAAKTYIWADTDQRTIESGQALAEGLFPGCTLPLNGLAEGVNDPLFHPAANGVKANEADAAFAELTERVKKDGDVAFMPLIEQLRQVLLGCAPKIACTPVRQPEMPLIGAGMAAIRGKGDHMVDLQGPLAQASTFAEDFLLEYADGMPADQVGWGHVDEAQLGRFLALHSDYFDLMHRTPAIAKVEASNILFHIERTLAQGAEGKPLADAVGSPETKLVMLVGHDTNLAAVASLLGVHWRLEGRDDDTPPGTQMAFELWQDAHGALSVRVTVAMQTLRQLRDLPPQTVPVQQTLQLPGCADSCSWTEFEHLAGTAIDKSNVFPMKTP